MTLVRALFVFAIVILPATSFAAPTAAIHVVSGDNVFDFLVVGSPNDVGTFTAILDVFESGFFNIDGDISSDADPFIQYSFGVQNFTASSQTFTFSFLEPIVGGPYTTLISSHASNVTDGGSGIVQVAPSGGTFIHRPQINGVETVGQLGDGCVVTVPSDACDGGFGNFPISSVSGPGTLGVTVAFTLSAGDAYATTGRVELTAVPEPSTLILSLSVLAGILYRQRRR